MNATYLGFALLLFLAVVLLLEGLYLAWASSKSPEAKRLQQRLRNISAGAHGGDTSVVKERLLSESDFARRLLLSVPRIHQLDRMLEQSGLQFSVGRFVLYCGVAGIAAALILKLVGMPFVICLAAGIGAASIPVLYVLRARKKRLHKIDEQLPEALDLIGRAMRAGHAFPTGLKMVGDEMPEPIAGEFRIVSDEVNYGISMEDALLNLCTRVPSTDLRYFAVAVLIQRETGGNLVEILTNIGSIIRERIKLMGKIRVLSAEGRLSAWILALLPFVLAMLLHLMNPKFMSVLWTHPTGLKVVYAACISMFFGILWMRRIIRIRV